MSTVDKKLSQRDATTSTTGAFQHIIIPSGSIFASRKISTANRIKADNADRTYTLIFDSTDLTAGVLSVNHAKATEDVDVKIINPSKVIYSGYTVTIVDDDNITVDFGGTIDAGNWTLKVRAYT